jgi:hypothetical protein
MIYDQADIVARRLLGQKVGDRVYYETAQTSEDIRNLLEKTARVVITAPRRSGKTTELLKYANEQHPFSAYCIVCLNQDIQRKIILRHRELFNAKNVAKRLNGFKIEETEVNPPLMLTPNNLELLRGGARKPVFVDEFKMLPEDAQKTILDSGLFVAAVTS